jgi:hypothetical protein
MPAKKGNQAGGRKKGTGSGRPASAKGSTGRHSKRNRSGGFLAGLAELVGMTYFGRVLLTLLITVIIILLDILISRNQYDLFFLIAGIELIAAAIVFWLRFILRRE